MNRYPLQGISDSVITSESIFASAHYIGETDIIKDNSWIQTSLPQKMETTSANPQKIRPE